MANCSGDNYNENPTTVRGSKVFTEDEEDDGLPGDDMIGLIAVQTRGETYYFVQDSSEEPYHPVVCDGGREMCERKLRDTHAKHVCIDSILVKDLLEAVENEEDERASNIVKGLMHMLIDKGKIGVE